jgi:hypothetical protein
MATGEKVTQLRTGRRIAVPGPAMVMWERMSEFCTYRVPEGNSLPCVIHQPVEACAHPETHPGHGCEYVKCPLIRFLIK